MPSTRSARARKIFGATAASALLLTLAACGDDDDDAAGTDTAAAANDDGDDDGGDSSGGGDFCADAQQLFEAADTIDEDEAIEAIRQLDPPDEIADDWTTMVAILDELASADPSDPDAAEAQAEALEGAQEASENVTEYLQGECGIDDE